MCFFLYSECNICRWPDLGRLRGVVLCEPFKLSVATKESREAFGRSQMAAEDLTSWQCLGLYTFVRADGGSYEIYMARDCARWSANPGPFLCKYCKEKQQQLNALLSVDFQGPQELSPADTPGSSFKPLAETTDPETSAFTSPTMLDFGMNAAKDADFDWEAWIASFALSTADEAQPRAEPAERPSAA